MHPRNTIRTGRLSPVLARRIAQWNPQTDDTIDILPPQLAINLENLHRQQPTIGAIDSYNSMIYASFNNQALSVGITDQTVLIQPPTRRVYLMIVNTHATQTLFLRFGGACDTTIGLPIVPLFGFYELDSVIPQDELHMIASGALTTGVLIYGNKDLQIK